MTTLRIVYLYPDELNIYGDRGNILTLYQRCKWRGLDAEIRTVGLTESVDPDWGDIYFMGGGQDAQQILVSQDLCTVKAGALRQAVDNGAVFLTICGGYQLLGHYYKPHNGPELRGLSFMDAYTVAGNIRHIGNVVIERHSRRIVGFENHSGRTYLGEAVSPLGHVIQGAGNNGEDGQEGAVFGNLYGTYLHGSLLPKNPALADELIEKSLTRRYGNVPLPNLPDTLEHQAQDSVVRLLQQAKG